MTERQFSDAAALADTILDYVRDNQLAANDAEVFVELVAELARDIVLDEFDVMSAEDIAYERAQRSEAWERMGGGGL